MLIVLSAPGQPVSAKNHTRPIIAGRKRLVIKSKAAQRWLADVVPALASQFARYGVPTITTHVRVDVHEYVRHHVDSTANPDGDNAMSGVWDALVAAQVLHDDRLIIAWGGTKQQDRERPRCDVEIRVLADRPQGVDSSAHSARPAGRIRSGL